ncbi:hypothetical protein NE662_09290, partial [Bifidobacterium pseudocatenulatum]|nr:hypothetical protein [Bifidobacterium pseudocatenulatum]
SYLFLLTAYHPGIGLSGDGVLWLEEEKITPPRARADVSTFSYVTVKNPYPGSGILTGFPFDGGLHKIRPLKRSFPIS